MPLISGSVPSLINGISQQPPTLRMPTQGEEQKNGFSHIARGLEKRPCTEHVSLVSGVTSTNSNDVFIHPIRRSEDEAYALVVKGGTVSNTITFTAVDTSSNEITTNSAHGLEIGDWISFKGADLPLPLVSGAFYKVKSKPSTTKITLENPDDSTQTLSLVDAGSGSRTLNVYNSQFKLYDLTGFATGTPGSEVFVHKETQTGTVTANGASLDGKANAYLSNFSTSNPFAPNKLSATTIADFTFLLNTTQTIKKNTTATQEVRDYESLVHFKVGDYSADFKITIYEYNVDDKGEINRDLPINQADGTSSIIGTLKTASNETISKTGTSSSLATGSVSMNNQKGVVVGNIARSFNAGNQDFLSLAAFGGTPALPTVSGDVIERGTYTGTTISTAGLNGASGGGTSRWTVTYTTGESMIEIKNDTNPFIVECTDGKGDQYMVAINGSDEVSKFGKLPGSKHPGTNNTGFVAKISGDRNSGQDDYYVKWTGSVWDECAKPKYPRNYDKYNRISLDETTMPMQLYKAFDNQDNIYFILESIDWSKREAGDDTTNPFPSFSNYDETDFPNGLYTINDIFFHRNRLGFISDENVILSSTAHYYDFFATTVLSVLDTAVIDVAVSNNQVAILKSAVPFQENLLLFSDLQQFKLASDAFLTPTTVTVDVATNFETSTEAKPVAAGKTIFFPFIRGAYSGIREYFIEIASETNDANEITSHVPSLIAGTVKKMAVSTNEEVLLVLSDTDRTELQVYKYYYADKEKLQSSWSVWKFDAEIIDMQFIGSVAFFLFRRGTSIYIEKLNLSVDNATTIMDDKIGVRLDRRVRLRSAHLSDYTPTPSAAWEEQKQWTNVAQTSTSGTGTGMKFTIETNLTGQPTFFVTNNGTGYNVNDTIVVTDPDSSSSSTATVTVTDVGTKFTLNDYYTDVDHDKIATITTTNKIRTVGEHWGTQIKIDADGSGLLMSPRVGQTFTSAHDATVTYTVKETNPIDTGDTSGTANKTCTITVTPSISKDAKIPDNNIITFNEREAVYVTEGGELLKPNTTSTLLEVVAGTLSRGTEFSRSKQNNSPDIFVGVPYEFKYGFSEQFIKQNDASVNSGRLQMRNFEISYAKTGYFTVEISPFPHDALYREVNVRTFTPLETGVLKLGELALKTGVYRVPVYCNSKDVKISVKSDSWLPLALQSVDWEAFQVLRNQRI